MYYIKTDEDHYEVAIIKNNPLHGKVNNKAYRVDQIKIHEGCFHILVNNQSYTAEILKIDKPKCEIELLINGARMQLQVKNDMDKLLDTMGMAAHHAGKIASIKAPMPGKVLDIMVTEGKQVKAGEPLLILEAMKMENILKSPTDCTIKTVHVSKEMSVAKDAVLLSFK